MKSRFAQLHRVTLPALIVALSGCASSSSEAPFASDRDYPACWPAIAVIDRACTKLSGTYSNAGTAIGEQGASKPVSLASLLPKQGIADVGNFKLGLLSDIEDFKNAKVISLKVTARPPSRVLLFATFYQSDLRTTADRNPLKQVDSKNWVTREGGNSYYLELPLEEHIGGATGVIGSYIDEVELMQAVDGSLIVRRQVSDGGIILFVPVVGTSHSYARFERVGD